MLSIAPTITTAVNASILTRPKLTHQSPDPWKPNAAFVNCYNGPTESVGYHSDQLTYLGPRAVIASISLGVAREFRVRRIVPDDDDSSTSPPPTSTSKDAAKSIPKQADIQGQISIHLPHNSLLIMHSSMQESWKHSIAPSPSIIPHPLSGNRRINITYRDYKPYLHPKFTPRCKCKVPVPAVLRVVQRKRGSVGRYFWMCYRGNIVGEGEGRDCGFFEWGVFDDQGVPVWKHSKVGGGGGSGKDEG